MRIIDRIRSMMHDPQERARERISSGVLWRDIASGARPIGPLGLLVPGGFDDLPAPDDGAVNRYLAQSQPCPTCHTRGAIVSPNGHVFQQCPNCGGSGTVDRWRREFYDYVFPTTIIALANGVASATVAILKDADFETYWIVGSPSTAGSWSVLITDNSTNTLWSNDPATPLWNENFAGTAQNPFELPIPRLTPAVASLTASFTDRTGVANNKIQLVFRGYKLLQPKPAPQPGAQA